MRVHLIDGRCSGAEEIPDGSRVGYEFDVTCYENAGSPGAGVDLQPSQPVTVRYRLDSLGPPAIASAVED
jgi:hypothetical protein